jgi:phosphoribosyl 1,2-cyclic phosphodiesterase
MSNASSGRFVVLASGSGGNAAVVDTPAGCVLLDFGLAPRTLERRMKLVGLGWSRIHAAVLTHTHTDHWKRETLAALADRNVPVFTHPDHGYDLARAPDAFGALKAKGLLQPYTVGRSVDLLPGVTAIPVAVPHDSDPTVAFRFDGAGWAVGYAADLGSTPPRLYEAFAGVDVLGLEFNHDVTMQRTSRRPEILIRRILSDHGHLSNEQATGFLCRFLERSGHTLRHVVQLHLSRECNRPALAAASARAALAGTAVQLTTAGQDLPTSFLPLGPDSVRPNGQPALPGCEG